MNNHADLPSGLRAQLDGFRRRLWLVETLVAVLGGACGLLASLALLFASDRIWDTPVWLRIIFAVTGTALAARYAWFWAHRWLLRPRDLRDLSRIVQRRYPRLGDRLLGVVELSDETHRPPNVSPSLCRAAIQQVAEEAAALDFQQAVSPRAARRVGVAVSGLLCFGLGLGLFVPSAAWNALARWAMPWANVARYTFAQLDGLDSQRVVPYGEPFDVSCQLTPASLWRPQRARGRYEGQPAVVAAASAGQFLFNLPGQTHAGWFSIWVGDARARLKVLPTFRPDLTQFTANITLPEYLQYPAQDVDARNGSLDVLAGSRVRFAGKVSRQLESARLMMSAPRPLRVNGDAFASDELELAETNNTCAFDWRDVLGLSASSPFVLKVNHKEDEPPRAEFRGIQRVVAMLEDEVLEFEARGEDDFGTRRVGLIWEGEAKSRGEMTLKDGAPQMKQVATPVRFAPLTMNIEPQRVTVRAYAEDYRPNSERSYSPPYTVFVLDLSEHAKLVQERFETLQSRLEEIARTEEALLDANQALRELPAGELASEKSKAQLEEQEHGEQGNAAALRRLTEDLVKLLREALRNKEIPASLLRDWAAVAEMLQPLGETAMPGVAKSLRAAQGDAAQRRGQVEKATMEQMEILQKLIEALKQMNRTGEDLTAANFINRLRKASATEREVSGKLSDVLPQTIGMRFEDLPPEVRKTVGSVEDKQRGNQRKVRDVRDDLGHFLRRVDIKRYKNVHKDMEDSNVVDELGNVAVLVHENKAGDASTQAASWSAQLAKWAQRMEPPEGESGGQGGSCSPSAAALELALKLMRIRQQEEGVREHTRYLDTYQDPREMYTDNSRRLARIQNGLLDNLQQIMDSIAGPPQVLQLLDKVGGAMEDAGTLLDKPQTDGETIAAETEVIELLSQACKGACSGGGMGSGLMAMLMSMGQGRAGGGSLAGGTTERPNDPGNGSAAGHAPDPRPVEHAGGSDTSRWPSEFREALEGYFRAVEGTSE